MREEQLRAAELVGTPFPIGAKYLMEKLCQRLGGCGLVPIRLVSQQYNDVEVGYRRSPKASCWNCVMGGSNKDFSLPMPVMRAGSSYREVF